MKRTIFGALLLVFLIGTASANTNEVKTNGSETKSPAADVAVVVKVVKDVQTKSEQSAFKVAQRGQNLNSGDAVKTGEKSFSILKFLDGSVIRVQENSEIKVRGEKDGAKLEKSVDINLGKLGFNVKQRPGEQFRFTSPTSVASIKGTNGAYTSDGNGSSLTISEGNGEFETKDGKKFQVGAGETAFVTTTGESGKRPASQTELSNASTSTKTGPIKIYFIDGDGVERMIEVPEVR